MIIIQTVVAILLIIGVIVALLYFVQPDRGWRYDKHNPYRRYCTKCNQQQDIHQHWNGYSAWENVGPPGTCKKHKEKVSG